MTLKERILKDAVKLGITFAAHQLARLLKTPNPSVRRAMGELVATGQLRRVETGVYALPAPVPVATEALPVDPSLPDPDADEKLPEPEQGDEPFVDEDEAAYAADDDSFEGDDEAELGSDDDDLDEPVK